MEKVILISSNKQEEQSLAAFFKDMFHCAVRTAASAGQARKILAADSAWELVVINAPLVDEFGIEFAVYAAENTAAVCILVMKNEDSGGIADTADREGILTVYKPFGRQLFYQVVKAAEISVRRTWKLYEETVRLEKKIDEIRITDKAKFALMQYKGMTEEEAHVFLERYAMNSRRKKSIAAAEIIDKLTEMSG